MPHFHGISCKSILKSDKGANGIFGNGALISLRAVLTTTKIFVQKIGGSMRLRAPEECKVSVGHLKNRFNGREAGFQIQHIDSIVPYE